MVLAGNLARAAESRGTDALRCVRNAHLVVEPERCGPLAKGDTHEEQPVGVLGTLDGFVDLAQEERAGSQDGNVHQTEHLHTLHVGIQTGTVTVTTCLGEDR